MRTFTIILTLIIFIFIIPYFTNTYITNIETLSQQKTQPEINDETCKECIKNQDPNTFKINQIIQNQTDMQNKINNNTKQIDTINKNLQKYYEIITDENK